MPGAVLATPAIRWTPYTYKLKSGSELPAELGILTVPAHHDHADGRSVTLRMVRLRALTPRPGVPVIYLAGGPGSSGIEAGQGSRAALFATLRRDHDIVLLDQRGTGLSDPPPACTIPWRFPADQASTEASFNASLEAAARACAAEWRAKGVDLSIYNTADNAADVAAVARALGGRVDLLGISYGTFLGFAVLRDHAALIERAVFAGAEGPDDTVKLPTQADAVLARLNARTAADPVEGKIMPDLAGSVRRVLAALDRAPVTVPAGKNGATLTISRYDVEIVTGFFMATNDNSHKLPGLFAAMERGDFTGMARMVGFLRGFYATLPAMPLAMDGASPVSPARLRQAAALVSRSVIRNGINAPSADFASALGIAKLPPRWRQPLHSRVPALFISGDLDSRTPPVNAAEVRRGFARSAHLILKGAGHDNDLLTSSPWIAERIADFLDGRPLADTTYDVTGG